MSPGGLGSDVGPGFGGSPGCIIFFGLQLLHRFFFLPFFPSQNLEGGEAGKRGERGKGGSNNQDNIPPALDRR